MQRRPLVALAATAAAVAVALAGCAGPSEPSGPVTITLWHNSSDPQALLDLYAAWEEESGNTIELVSVPADGFEDATLTRWASGDRPDVLEYHATLGNLVTLNPSENLRDLSDEDYVAKSGSLYDSAGSVDGTVYAAIIGFPQVFGLYYNKDVVAAAGIEAPQTFDELAAACEAVTAASPGVAPIFEAGASIWPPQILPLEYVSYANEGNDYGRALRANEVHVDDADSPVLAGLEGYAALLADGCMNPDVTTATFEDSMAALVNGEAAFVAQHSDMLPTLLDAAGGDQERIDATIGFVPFSGDSPALTYAASPIGTYYLPKTGDAAKEAAALDFIRYITGDGYQSYLDAAKTFPVIDGFETPDGIPGILLEVKAAYDEGPTAIAFNSDVPGMAGFAQLMSELIAGQKTPEQVAADLQSQIEQAAKAQGLDGW